MPVVIGRRSARLSVIVPLTIRGVAANGKTFKENTWTTSINKQGANLFAFHEPTVGDEITIENPVLGRTAKGRVVRVCEKRFPEDPYEIAVELADAQNVWGVKFPPEDWQRERPAASASHPPAKATETSVPAGELNGSGSAKTGAEAADRSATGPAPTPKGVDGQAERFNQVNLAITGLSRFARQADEGAGKQAAPGDDMPSAQKESMSPAYYQEALRILEDRTKKVRALERDLDATGGRIENSRAELEGLLSKIREAEQRWQEAAGRVGHDIQEASEQALQSSLDKAKLKIQEEIASVSFAVMAGAQKRFQEESTTWIEGLLGTAKTRLGGSSEEWFSKISSELRAREEELVEKAKGEIGRVMEAHTGGLRDSFRKLAGEMSASLLSEVEKSLQTAAQGITAKHAESLKGQAERLRCEQEASLRQILQEAQQNLAKEVAKGEEKLKTAGERLFATTKAGLVQGSQEAADALNAAATATLAQVGSTRQKLDEISKELAENFRKQLAEASTKALEGSRNYTEAQFQGLRAEADEALRQAQGQRLEGAADRLRKLSEETLQSVAAQLQKATGGELERIREGLAAAEKKAFEELGKQLTAVGQSRLESLLVDAKATSEEYRAHLRKVLQEFQERGERELAAHFQSIVDRQREAARELLRTEAGAASERISAEIKAHTERMIKEASDSMYKQVGLAAVAMKGWTDDARAQVETQFQKYLADFEQRIRESSRASISTYHSELRFLAENLSARLENASRLFQGLEEVAGARPEEPAKVPQVKLSSPGLERLELSPEELRARQAQGHRESSESRGHRAPDLTNEPPRHPQSPNKTKL